MRESLLHDKGIDAGKRGHYEIPQAWRDERQRSSLTSTTPGRAPASTTDALRSSFAAAGRRAAELWLTKRPSFSPRQWRITCFRSLVSELGRVSALDACHESFDHAFKARIAAARTTDEQQAEVRHA